MLTLQHIKLEKKKLKKAKTILNDKNAKKITVAKLEQALFNARITLEKQKTELVFLKDSEIYKPLGKDVVITKEVLCKQKILSIIYQNYQKIQQLLLLMKHLLQMWK